MAGVTIDLKTDDREIKALLNKLNRRMTDLSPAFAVIGEIVRASVLRNFEKGGRPKWKPLSRVTKKRRKKDGLIEAYSISLKAGAKVERFRQE